MRRECAGRDAPVDAGPAQGRDADDVGQTVEGRLGFRKGCRDVLDMRQLMRDIRDYNGGFITRCALRLAPMISSALASCASLNGRTSISIKSCGAARPRR